LFLIFVYPALFVKYRLRILEYQNANINYDKKITSGKASIIGSVLDVTTQASLLKITLWNKTNVYQINK